jgi:hypothetical protein
VHGQTQTELTAAQIDAAKAGGSAYYQVHGDTTYYLIRTPLVPLLMPLKGIVPDPILGAIDPVLRTFIEMGYNRSDYSAPTKAQLLPGIGLLPSLPGLPAAASTTADVKAAAPASVEASAAAATPKASTPKATASKASAPKKAASADNDGRKKGTGGSARPSKAND